MQHTYKFKSHARYAPILLVLFLVLIASCTEPGTTNNANHNEESAQQFTLDQAYDMTRNGMRLMLSYNRESASFTGRVSNTTEQTIGCVRVEVHLSNGIELGPTPRVNLPAGQTIPVTLRSEGSFVSWGAHPESGCSGSGGEGGGESGGESGDESGGEHGSGEGRESGGEH